MDGMQEEQCTDALIQIFALAAKAQNNLPPEIDKSGQSAPKIARKMVLRGSINNDSFQMTLSSEDGGILSGTYFLDKDGWTKASVLRGKIDKPFDTPLLHTLRNTGYSVHAPR